MTSVLLTIAFAQEKLNYNSLLKQQLKERQLY